MKFLPSIFWPVSARRVQLETPGQQETFVEETRLNLQEHATEVLKQANFVKGRLNWTETLKDANWKNEGQKISASQLFQLARRVDQTMGVCYKTDSLALLFDTQNNPFVAIKRQEKIQIIGGEGQTEIIPQKLKKPEEEKKQLPDPSAKHKTVVVKKGDTVYSILRDLDIDPAEGEIVSQIKKINTLDSQATLGVGMMLKIPLVFAPSEEVEKEYSKAGKEVLHRFKKGETVFSLYRDFEKNGVNLYDNWQDFQKAFVKQNGTLNIFLEKEYILPGVTVATLKKGQTLEKLMEQEGFYTPKWEAVFRFNQDYNPAFSRISKASQIPANIKIFLPLAFLATGEKEIPDVPEVVSEKPHEVFALWDKSIEKKNNSLKNLRIVLDPGHGRGTRSSFPVDLENPERGTRVRGKKVFMNEHEIVYDVSMRLYKKLKENGAEVISTVIDEQQSGGQIREENPLPRKYPDENYNKKYLSKKIPSGYRGAVTDDCSHRVEIAQKFFREKAGKTEFYIAIHSDARLHKGNGGLEFLLPTFNESYYPKRKGGEKQRKLDQDFGQSLVQAAHKNRLPVNGDGKRIAGTYMMRHKNRADARLYAEVGDAWEPNEGYRLRTGSYRQKLADALYDAIVAEYKKRN